MKVLCAAGKRLAENSPKGLRERIASMTTSSPPAALRVAAHALAAGPDEWADDAIRWLIAETRRFRCGTFRRGSGNRGGVYRPAARLLRRFGQHCSDTVFQELERVIASHKPKWELVDFKICHQIFMGEGWSGAATRGFIYPRRMFLGQFLLLTSLSRKRLGATAQDWAGVLRRKFGEPRQYLHEPRRSMGGFVGSTIPQDRLALVSDDQWLDIVGRDWSSKAHKWKQMGKGVIGEVKPETLASDLGSMARRQPTRFARLVLRFPVDVDSHYMAAVLRALAETAAPEKTSDWRPADVKLVEEVIAHFEAALNQRDLAGAFCWLVQKRSSEAWSDQTLQRLVHLATTHPHPAAGEYTAFQARNPGAPVSEEDADVSATATNCVRGEVAGAIEAILYHRLEKLELLQPAINALITDLHPAVRIAAIGLSIPLLNGDRTKAVDQFLQTCDHPDDEIFNSHDIDRFLSYTLLDHLERLRPLIERMLRSSTQDVASRGTVWTTEAWIHSGALRDQVEQLAKGKISHRKGVAESLAHNVAHGRGDDGVVLLLGQLFDDGEKEVRDAAAAVFRSGEVFTRSPSAVKVAERFVTSAALEDNIDDLLFGLRQFTGSLVLYANAMFLIVDRLTGALAADARDMRTRRPLDVDELAKLLLRLYEQSEQDRALRRRCLDAWDRLLAERAG